MSTTVARDMTNGRKLARLAKQVEGAHLAVEASLRKTIDTALRVGEFLSQAKELCGHGRFGKWVEVNTNISRRRAQEYLRLWKRRSELSNARDSAHLTLDAALRLLRCQTCDRFHSSDSVEWYTPQDIIDRVVQVLGTIGLDPCSNQGEPNIPARRHYTADDNGLIRPWRGKVYMNPPYDTPVSQFVEKLIAEYERGRVNEAIAMLPDATSSIWFQSLWKYVICFASPRITFIDGTGRRDNPGNTHGSAVVYLGNHPERFCEVFQDIGIVTTRFKG